jgi:hypothetical protein
MDKLFRQVKHLPADSTTWFFGNDNLAGTTTIGIEGTTTAEWAINFSGMTFSNFLFASGDFMNFVYTSKSILNVSGIAEYEVLQTSNSQTPSNIEVFNRGTANDDDPTIGTTTTWNENTAAKSFLYLEDGVTNMPESF